MELLKGFGFMLIFIIISTSSQPQKDSADRYLSLPQLDKCNNRFKGAQYKNRNFFFSGYDPELKDDKFDWLDSRNTCRERCMETVSFETQEKFDFFKNYIEQNNISFVWTSGRLCDFAGCEGRWDLLPKRIKGWLWSANQVAIAETNKIPPGWSYQPWSFTGIRKKPQPDNAEMYISQTSEACLGILNNMYNDSVAWHDIGELNWRACSKSLSSASFHELARFICEDSEILLKEVLEPKVEPTVEDIEELPTSTTFRPTKRTTVKTEKTTTTQQTSATGTTEDPLEVEITADPGVDSNSLKRHNSEDETSIESSTKEVSKETETSTASEFTEASTTESFKEAVASTKAESVTEAKASSEFQAPSTTKHSRLRGRQRETTTTVADKSSTAESKRRRVFRTKPPTDSNEGKTRSENDEKDSETTKSAQTTATIEREIVKENETSKSTDDAQSQEKIVEEVQSTTEADAPKRAGRRFRKPAIVKDEE